ncbi:MAG: hypothetical protein H0X36_02475 [Sphingomonadaceae bacterium]|nr:hypothetical protein [Sphingomonadaceae bacterium]
MNLDLFAFLMWQANLDKFEVALAERRNLFEFIRTASEHEFLARIVNLFARRTDTDNFAMLVSEALSAGAIDEATYAATMSQITAADGAYRVAKTIRHKLVSHQDDTRIKSEIYRQLKPTLPMFIELSDQSLAIASALCSARGLQAQAVFTAPAEQLEEMLAELQRDAQTADS